MSADSIRIARNGKTIGDFNLAGLGTALRNKSILLTDYYWRNGMNSWERVSLIADEALAAAPAATLPAKSKLARNGVMVFAAAALAALIATAFYQLGKSEASPHEATAPGVAPSSSGSTVRSPDSTASSLVKGLLSFGRSNTPLRSEFYRSKAGEMYFKVWIDNDGDIPYDDFVWKITKIQAPDGRRFSNSYPVTKQLLLKGRFMNSHEWGGVNPYGSDCHPGDRFVIEIPKYGPLVIDAPDSAKGLKVLPFPH